MTEKLKALEERLDRLENHSKTNFFEVEKKLEKLEGFQPSEKPEEDFEERIQELEDLVMLLELENTKIKERLATEPLLEQVSTPTDIESRFKALENKLYRIEEIKASHGKIVVEKGEAGKKIFDKINEIEERLSALDEIEEKISSIEERASKVATKEGKVETIYEGRDFTGDIAKLKREIEEIRKETTEMRIPKSVLNRLEDLEFGLRDIDKKIEEEISTLEKSVGNKKFDAKTIGKMMDDVRYEIERMEATKREMLVLKDDITKMQSADVSHIEKKVEDNVARNVSGTIEKIIGEKTGNIDRRIKSFDRRFVDVEEKLREVVKEEFSASFDEQKREISRQKKSLESLRKLIDEKLDDMENQMKGAIKSETKGDLKSYKKEIEKSSKLLVEARKSFDLQIISIEERLKDAIKKETRKEIEGEIDAYKRELEEMMKEIEKGITRAKQIGPELENQRRFLEDMRKTFDLKTITLEEKIQRMIGAEIKKDLRRDLERQKKELDEIRKNFHDKSVIISKDIEQQISLELRKKQINLENLMKRLEQGEFSDDTRKHIEDEVEKHSDELAKLRGMLHDELSKVSGFGSEIEKDKHAIDEMAKNIGERIAALESRMNSPSAGDIADMKKAPVSENGVVVQGAAQDGAKRSLDMRMLALEDKIEKMFSHELRKEIEKHRNAIAHIEQKFKQDEATIAEDVRKLLRSDIDRTKQSLDALSKKYQQEEKTMTTGFRNHIENEIENKRRVISDLEKKMELEINRVKMIRPPEELIREVSSKYEKGLRDYSEQMKRDVKSEIRNELVKDLEARATKVLTREFEDFANMLDKRMPRFVTRDEFERSWAMIRTPDTGQMMRRIDFLEMKLNEIYTIVRNLGARLPVIVE